MKKHHANRASVFVMGGVGLVVAAAAALIAVMYQPRVRPVIAAPTYETQKNALDTYVHDAVAIHTALRAHTITVAQAKTRALALVVPSVLKERHLAWIFALDTNDLAAADALMRDYTLLQIVR
jgi:hypothetical protein